MSIEERLLEAYNKKEVLKQVHNIDVTNINVLIRQWEEQYENDNNDVHDTMNQIDDEIVRVCNSHLIVESTLFDHFDNIKK